MILWLGGPQKVSRSPPKSSSLVAYWKVHQSEKSNGFTFGALHFHHQHHRRDRPDNWNVKYSTFCQRHLLRSRWSKMKAARCVTDLENLWWNMVQCWFKLMNWSLKNERCPKQKQKEEEEKHRNTLKKSKCQLNTLFK